MSGPGGSRKCHVVKTGTEEFEFFLSVDEVRKGQIITSVTKGGPADRAGLKDGDRVIFINGNNVEKKSHNDVVAIIRECIPTNEIIFIVVDASHDPNAKSSSQPKKSTSTGDFRPRLCKIKKKNNSFGFFLEAHGDPSPGHFIKKVTKGGAADGTGLRDGDRIIAVGKVNVEKQKHAEVVNLIKKSGNKVALLVIDEEGYQDFKNRNAPITEKMVKGVSTSSRTSSSSEPKQQPAKAAPSKTNTTSTKPPTKSSDHKDKGKVRVVHVFKHPTKGYGFFLRSKKGSSGEFIGDIDAGGSAELAGLYDGDRLVAVNGKSIEGMPHADVIGLIKTKQAQVVLVVMDDLAKKHFGERDDFPSLNDIVRGHSNAIRTVKLVRGAKGYGMFLKMEKGCQFHIFSDVEINGVAHSAGLKDGEIVIAVEGSSVLVDTHEECVQKIKDAGTSVEMIVGSRATSEFLVKVGVAIGLDLAKEWPSEEEFAVPTFGKTVKPKVEKKDEPKPIVAAKEHDNDLGMKPRLCHIVRQDGGFGFFLKDDKGHFLINVEKTGPAFKAGALDYDRIVEINGENVEKLAHNQVVDKIRSSGNEITFLVVNKEEDKFFQQNGILITASLLNTGDELADEHKPRLCHLVRTNNSYGFHLMADSKREGQFVKEIAKGGAAENGGLREGDRIIEVNGASIIGAKHGEIVNKIKQKKDEVTFLVVDKEGDNYYKLKKIKIVAALAVAKAVAEERDAEKVSIGNASVGSSVIETEVTVHQDDKIEGAIAAAAIAAVVTEVEENEKENGEIELVEEIRKEIEDKLDDEEQETLASSIEAAVDEIEEVLDERADEEQEKSGAMVKAALASSIVAAVDEIEEVLDERADEEHEENKPSLDEEQVKSGEPVKAALASSIVAAVDEIEEVLDERSDEQDEENKPSSEAEEEIEEINDDKEGLTPAGKAAIAVVAVAAVREIVENGDAERSDSNDSRPPSPEIKSYDETLYVEQVIENHIEQRREEQEEEDEENTAAKVAALLVQHEIAEKFSEKDDESDREEEPKVEEKEREVPPVVVVAAVVRPSSPVYESPRPAPAKQPELPKSSIYIVPKPSVREVENPPTPVKTQAVPLSVMLTDSGELPNLKPTRQPDNKPKGTWGRSRLRPVNRNITVSAATPAVKQETPEKESGPKVLSAVAALRAAIELKNRESQQSSSRNDVKSELAELSKQGGGIQHAQKFGGSVKKPQEDGPTKKKNAWVGEGMTIKIIET